jgi:hypothetical protein
MGGKKVRTILCALLPYSDLCIRGNEKIGNFIFIDTKIIKFFFCCVPFYYNVTLYTGNKKEKKSILVYLKINGEKVALFSFFFQFI